VRETRIAVAAEVALVDPAVGGAVEHRAPPFELAHPVGRLPGVQLRHAPVVDVLAAAHRVGDVDLPAVALSPIGQRRGDRACGHLGVGLAELRVAGEGPRVARGRGPEGRAQAGAHGADAQHIVIVMRELDHQKSLRSDQPPMEHSRM
jgi:hypothetical protein